MNLRTSRAKRLLRMGVVASLLVTGFASCTLLGSRDLVQCTDNEGCPNAPHVCSDGLCQVDLASVRGDAALADSAEDAAVACTTSRDCPQVLPAQCESGFCVPVQSSLCPFVFPAGTLDLGREDTILVASYSSIGTQSAAEPASQASRFAFDEVRTGTHGISSPRIVTLYCAKDSRNPQQVKAVVDHLVARNIPLVFGAFDTSELQLLEPSVRDRIAIWSTLGNAKSLQPPAAGSSLLWFFLDELAGTASGFQPVFDRAAAKSVRDAGADVRVAIAIGPQEDAKALRDALQSALTVNGKLLNANPPLVQYFATNEASEIIAATPDIVIAIGGDEVVPNLLQAVEKTIHPRWVLGARSKYNFTALQSLVAGGANVDFRRRISGVDFSGSRDGFNRFRTAALGKVFPEPITAFDTIYDTAYAATFAAIVAQKKRAPGAAVRAEDMNAALSILIPADTGAASRVTASAQTEGFTLGTQLAQASTPFVMEGSTGPWIFDRDKHTRRMTSSLYCIAKGGATPTFYVDIAQADTLCE